MMQFSFVLTCVCLFFGIWYLGSVLYLRRGLSRNSRSTNPHGHRFSVIIAARNEEKSIERCIRSLMQQSVDSSRYEVIVANDRSIDATRQILEKLRQEFENLYIIDITTLPIACSPKKNALTQAISIAKNEIIVYTDADCVVGERWLESIDCHFEENVGLVQGITTYHRDTTISPLLYGFQAIEFLSHGIVSAAAIGAGFPLNSNANNLAFRKSIFKQIDGYSTVQELVSGDDDLLLQRIWRDKSWKLRYMTDTRGAVTTTPTPTLRGVFEQRKRWGSKTVHYNPGQIMFLGGIFSFYLSLITATGAAFLSSDCWPLAGILWFVKLLGEALLMIPGMRMFRQQFLLPYFLPASVLQLPMIILAVLLGVFGSYEWKQQRFMRKMKKEELNV
ncbi:MAG: glycosyltransferase [Chitinispirillaceae bacterium]